MEQVQEIERLRKQVLQQERRLKEVERLVGAVRETLTWAEFNGAGYTVGRLPIDNLRKAFKRLLGSDR